MLGNEVITLSSDDEQDISPPRKRIKPIPVGLCSAKPKSPEKSTVIPETKVLSCIILSDDEEEPTKTTTTPSVTVVDEINKVLDAPSTSKGIENGTSQHDHSIIEKVFRDFINKCLENIKVPNHRTVVDEKLQYMQDLFDKYLQLTEDSSDLQHSLESNIINVTSKPKCALIYFVDIYQLLSAKLRDVTLVKQAILGKERIIKKLERTLVKLKRRIDKLEQSECDFDDEENSAFMQEARYKQRATEIHVKLCKYRKLNPYSGRVLHQRLKFKESKHPEINEAINKKYKNNTVFPAYCEMEKLIQQCAQDNSHLKMSNVDVKIESQQCFEKLGNYIQGQRKLDLYTIHSHYIMDTTDDPAKDSPYLQGKLLESYQIKVEKENEIFEKYSALQEKGVAADENDSENSVLDSDADNDENNCNEVNENDPKIIESIDID